MVEAWYWWQWVSVAQQQTQAEVALDRPSAQQRSMVRLFLLLLCGPSSENFLRHPESCPLERHVLHPRYAFSCLRASTYPPHGLYRITCVG